MKIINKTEWNSKALRKLCRIVAKKMMAKTKHIEIIYSRKSLDKYRKDEDNIYHGRAGINSTWLEMQVPRPMRIVHSFEETGNGKFVIKPHEFNTKNFAQVLEHEMEHNFGLQHKDMVNYWEKDVSYIGNIKVEANTENIKPRKDYALIRHQRAEKKLKELKSRLKRIQNMIVKYNRKVKYYERRKSMQSKALQATT